MVVLAWAWAWAWDVEEIMKSEKRLGFGVLRESGEIGEVEREREELSRGGLWCWLIDEEINCWVEN